MVKKKWFLFFLEKPLLIIAGIVLLLKLPYIHFVPLWDGGLYMYCLKNAVSIPFKLSNFSCTGHTSIAYMLLLSVGQLIGWGSVEWVNITNTILYIVSGWAFYLIILELFPRTSYVERLILTLLLIVNPSLLANSLNINLDFGLFVFFQIFFLYILRGKYLESIFFGLLMIFSKETGVVIYGITVFWFVLKQIFFRRQVSKLKNIFFLFPCVLLLIYVVQTKTFWILPASTSSSLFKSILNSTNSWSNRTYVSNIYLVFGLNFMWLTSCVIAIAAIKKSVCFIKSISRSNKRLLFRNHGVFILIFISFITIACVLIGYKTYANSRYFLVLIPGLMIFLYMALRYLIRNYKARLLIMGVFCLLFYIQCFRSIDPIGFLVYGGFDFGKHRMYKMTSLTQECCGYGRDQLIYNLEYTKLHDISNYILTDLKPKPTDVFSSVSGSNYYMNGALDAASYRRSYESKKIINLNYRSGEEIVNDSVKPQSLYFIVFPNFPSKEVLGQLYRYYNKQESITYDINGYQIEVIKMDLLHIL